MAKITLPDFIKSASTDPATRKRVYAALGSIYDKLIQKGKVVTPEILASMYAYLEW